jgi:hypothetical protein
MGHKQPQEQGLLELIEQARTVTRELREALADVKRERRAMNEEAAAALREIAQHGRQVVQQVLIEAARIEHDRLKVEIDGAIAASHRMIEKKATEFWDRLTAVSQADNLTVSEVVVAQATLDRFIELGPPEPGKEAEIARRLPKQPKGAPDEA